MKQRSGTYRVWHRWLSLVLGVQMVIWAISGAYMVIVQLPFIHGVHLTQESDQKLPVNPVCCITGRGHREISAYHRSRVGQSSG